MRAALFFLAFLTMRVVAAADGPPALRGVSTIAIVVEPLPPAVAGPLTETALASEVERRLANPKLSIRTSAADATVIVSVNAVPIETAAGVRAGVAYSVYVSVQQPAIVASNGAAATATTWRRGGLGVASRGRAARSIRDQLGGYLDLLAADWKAANDAR